MRDAGNLLGRAGLTLPAVDSDTLTVQYKSVVDVVEHLRLLGEGNAVLARRRTLSRDTALAAAALYETMFEAGGSVPATFNVIYMAGWAPAEGQQRSKERGSATASFADIEEMLGEEEGKR